MIGKHWMRLLREGLLKLYSEFPQFRDYTVYYMAAAADKFAQAAAVRSLHALDFLPWPEEACIIALEESAISPTGARILGLYVYFGQSRVCVTGVDSGSQAVAMLVHYVVGQEGNAIRHGVIEQCAVYRRDFDMGELSPEEIVAQELAEAGGDRSEGYAEYIARCMPYGKGEMWMGLLLGEDGFVSNIEVGVAVLASLANLATPCHYRVLAQSKGFGSKAVRQAIQAKPFICIVAFDRLYTTQSSASDGHPKTPHSRCGHIRHLWKEAGLNRNALPPEPEKRLRLVADHHVRRIYVHPTWVGARTYEADGLTYDIQGGESELPLLN